MKFSFQRRATRFVVTAGAACLASPLFAQSLVVTNGSVVTYVGDTVPDSTGADIPTYTVTSLDNACVDDAGNLYFRGTFTDAPATLDGTNNTAWFLGSARSNLKMGLRAGTQAPGLPAGYLLRNTLTTSSALSSNVRVSPRNGWLWSPSNTWDSVSTTITTQSLFGGTFAVPSFYQAQGDAAPGCAPETFAQTFSGISLATSGQNSQGHVAFQATLSGPTTDRFGIFEGVPGSVSLVQRSNFPTNGITGTSVLAAGTPFGSTLQINDANDVLYEVILSQTTGATPALPSNDRALIYYAPSTGTYSVLVREGDVLPGTSGATFNAVTGDAWTPGQSGVNWTNSRRSIFSSELRGGDVVGTTNNLAVVAYDGFANSIVARKGDAALPTDGTFSTFLAGGMMVNDAGNVCFQSTLTGGTVTTANDTTIWAGTPGSLQLVCREGQVMPGTGGGTAGTLGTLSFNAQGRVLFLTTLAGGTVPGASWWLWDPSTGLKPVILANDVITIPSGPGAGPKTLTGAITTFTNANGDGASMRFTNTGRIGLKATIAAGSGGGTVLVSVDVPPNSPTTAFCFGDGTGTACPCANSGAVGNGCANSLNPNGGNLIGSGLMSIANDTFTLAGSGVPNGPGLYFQADNQLGAGSGVTFGDGLRCAGGNVFRLGIVIASGNTSTYPNGIAPNNVPISLKGFCAAGNTRQYQLWYRDSDPVFCTASVFNLTNGLTGVWTP